MTLSISGTLLISFSSISSPTTSSVVALLLGSSQGSEVIWRLSSLLKSNDGKEQDVFWFDKYVEEEGVVVPIQKVVEGVLNTGVVCIGMVRVGLENWEVTLDVDKVLPSTGVAFNAAFASIDMAWSLSIGSAECVVAYGAECGAAYGVEGVLSIGFFTIVLVVGNKDLIIAKSSSSSSSLLYWQSIRRRKN